MPIQSKSKDLENDLGCVLSQTESDWEALRNKRIFITGGTGFFGCWFLESFIWVNTHFNLNAKAMILSRDPDAFLQRYPHFKGLSYISFHQGDVKNFKFPQGKFSHLIHAATTVNTEHGLLNPLQTHDTIYQGTRHVLNFAKQCGVQAFLLVSSGAVYGKLPGSISAYHESQLPQLDSLNASSAYAIGKLAAEHVCALYHDEHALPIKIARCFAFIGPYMPLNSHHAVGNFLRDGLAGKQIIVQGDGSPYRSYLYAADMVAWLWKILFRGNVMKPYNVGSDEAITILELAELISQMINPNALPVLVSQKTIQNVKREYYVPDITRAQHELQLIPSINLPEAVQLTAKWFRNQEVSL